MMIISTKLGLLAVLGTIAASPVSAQEKVGPHTHARAIANLDIRPATVHAARRTLTRIEEAALEVCGAPRGALREVRRAMRKSECWKESVDRAVTAIGNPLLIRVHGQGK